MQNAVLRQVPKRYQHGHHQHATGLSLRQSGSTLREHMCQVALCTLEPGCDAGMQCAASCTVPKPTCFVMAVWCRDQLCNTCKVKRRPLQMWTAPCLLYMQRMKGTFERLAWHTDQTRSSARSQYCCTTTMTPRCWNAQCTLQMLGTPQDASRTGSCASCHAAAV